MQALIELHGHNPPFSLKDTLIAMSQRGHHSNKLAQRI